MYYAIESYIFRLSVLNIYDIGKHIRTLWPLWAWWWSSSRATKSLYGLHRHIKGSQLINIQIYCNTKTYIKVWFPMYWCFQFHHKNYYAFWNVSCWHLYSIFISKSTLCPWRWVLYGVSVWILVNNFITLINWLNVSYCPLSRYCRVLHTKVMDTPRAL